MGTFEKVYLGGFGGKVGRVAVSSSAGNILFRLLFLRKITSNKIVMLPKIKAVSIR